MTADYRKMWEELDLDLPAHDCLLQTLGNAYKDIYLSQKNRPEGMKYFDFVLSEIHGLRIKELRDAQAAGRKVIGSFCLYVPEELILAADAVSIGLCAGASIGTAEAEKVLPRNTCALIKSFVGFALAKLCPYVESADLVIGETTCDGKTKAYEIFGDFKKMRVMQIPRMKSDDGKRMWRNEIGMLKTVIENLTGRKITADKLREGIRIANEKRRAFARLNAARAANPAPISGLDALIINQAQFYDDPVRIAGAINELANELEKRAGEGKGISTKDAPRILMSGCPMAAPNWKVPFVVEKNGAVIVGEESCVGERGTKNLVNPEGANVEQMLDAIAERYFKINCACFTPNKGRIEDVLEMAKKYHAAGVVHYSLMFCGPYTTEAYLMEEALRKAGIPMLKIETDYSMEDAGQIDVRVQAFLEILKNKKCSCCH
jgi:benzoyl-CoA reductase/2-hydroxyglutaryl-CoA dehydratase subunit BcrC/BadD/HgdB